MNEDQSEALNKAHEAALRLKRFADKAHLLQLPILEQWLREASIHCQTGIDFQMRAMESNLLTQTEPKVIDNKPNDKQAEVMADTMKRRGLL